MLRYVKYWQRYESKKPGIILKNSNVKKLLSSTVVTLLNVENNSYGHIWEQGSASFLRNVSLASVTRKGSTLMDTFPSWATIDGRGYIRNLQRWERSYQYLNRLHIRNISNKKMINVTNGNQNKSSMVSKCQLVFPVFSLPVCSFLHYNAVVSKRFMSYQSQ